MFAKLAFPGALAVRYVFLMSPDRISLVFQLGERNCLARIECGRCNHMVTVSPAIMERLFNRLLSLDVAAKRLTCTKCLKRGARIQIIYPRGR